MKKLTLALTLGSPVAAALARVTQIVEKKPTTRSVG